MKQKEMYCHCFSQKVLNFVLRALFITWKYSHAHWDFIWTLAIPPSFLNSRRGGFSVLGVSCSIVLCFVCPLNREEKCSVQVSHVAVRKLHLCCVGKCGGVQQGRGRAHYTDCSHLSLVLVWVRCAPQSECTCAALSELPPMKYAGKEKVSLCQLSLHTHVDTFITNPASSQKSEWFCTSKLKCVLPTFWVAAAKCPTHVLFYESLASMRLYYYYYSLS